MARPPSTGQLDRRITIQTFVAAGTDSGEPLETYSTLATRWAEVHQATGREIYRAGTPIVTTAFTFVVRRDSVTKTVTPRMRILWDGRTFDVVGPPRDAEAAREFLEILATERV